MDGHQIVNESQLDAWVRGHPDLAPKTIVELVWRLVCISCPRPKDRKFPLSIGQHGVDGKWETDKEVGLFIPEGKSIWEIGTGVNAKLKAENDYNNTTKKTPKDERKESTFIFVTPLSGRRDWPDTWKADGISTWVAEKKVLNKWKDVRVLDGCQLVDWVSQFPGVGHWLAKIIGLPTDFDTAESYWDLLRSYGASSRASAPLLPDLFIVGRNSAAEKLHQLIVEPSGAQLRFDTRHREYSKYYVSALVASLDKNKRIAYQSKILILRSPENFRTAANSLNEPHVLVWDFDLGTNSGHELIQNALSKSHAVIYSSTRGGQQDNSCKLHPSNIYEMRKALIKSGHSEEHARVLTERSEGDWNALLCLFQAPPARPAWATQSEANDLVIAQLIGKWQVNFKGDQDIIEQLSGQAYKEWIVNIQRAAIVLAAPIEFLNEHWKFTSRYEPWTYLGELINPQTLNRFGELATTVLSESDPSLDLPQDQRFAASVLRKKPQYSQQLRKGVSETLALLGAQGENLSSRLLDRPQRIADQVVNTLLETADSKRWASLNDVLPLLAEAAPDVFLKITSDTSEKNNGPFSGVFAEEGDSLFRGGSYMTGLLWALESLAWKSDYLLRVCGILANLASIDPGGQCANRPSSSLAAILLPRLPQTTADADRRYAAVKFLIREQPDVAWELLLRLLPTHHPMSADTHRPKWRNFIPENWHNKVMPQDYRKDEIFYADLALELAGTDLDRLGELLEYDFHFHPAFGNFAGNYRNRLLSKGVLALSQDEHLQISTALETKISNHRKFANDHAHSVHEEKLKEVAEKLRPDNPMILHKRLFSNRSYDLHDRTGNWNEWLEELLQLRIDALREIVDKSDFPGLMIFCRSVDAPGAVGNAFASDSELADDSRVLPTMLESGNNCDLRFAIGYVGRRFDLYGWDWLESIDRSTWSVEAKAQFLAALPFVSKVWECVETELADKSAEYWKIARASADRQNTERIGYAISQLIENGRLDRAIQCIVYGDLRGGEFSELGLRALKAITDKHHIDTYSIGEIFIRLQDDADVDEDQLADMEMKFLGPPGSFHLYPRTLYRLLSEQPDFFCEVIRLNYRPKDDVETQDEEKIEIDENKKNWIQRARWLLDGWNHPPGLRPDKNFTEDGFLKWIDAVKTACTESGHWDVASRRIGEVLFYTPNDESGLWIEPVCELLNSKDCAESRRGLAIQIYNARGVHCLSEGKEEIALAEKWETLARQAEEKGFTRLAASLHEIGKRYRHEARQSVLEHQHRSD